jgi:hypothetical protein
MGSAINRLSMSSELCCDESFLTHDFLDFKKKYKHKTALLIGRTKKSVAKEINNAVEKLTYNINNNFGI